MSARDSSDAALARSEGTQVGRGSARRVLPEHVLAAALVALLLLAPFYVGSVYILRVATLVCMYGVMALGWNLVGGFAGQISLGHAVFSGLGAYATALLFVHYGISPWLGMLVGMVVAVAVAMLIGAPAFQLTGHYFALATIALLEIARILFTTSNDFTGGTVGQILPIPTGSFAMISFRQPIWYFYLGAVLLLIALAISRWVWRSRLGFSLRAIKQNPEAAELAGVNVFRSKMTALVLSAALVAVAGGFYMVFVRFIDPESAFSLNLAIEMALFAIVGGVGLWWGPALGALLLVPLGQYASLKLTGNLSAAGQLIYGALLIIIILWRPRGLGAWLETRWDRVWGREP